MMRSEKMWIQAGVLAAAAMCAPWISAQDKAAEKPAEKQSAPAKERVTAPYDRNILDCSKQATRAQGYDCMEARSQKYVYLLQNAPSQNDANEILVAIRNMFDPALKVFLLAGDNAIAFSTYPEEYARIEPFIRQIDRPKKNYRLTFTITDFDGDRRVGTQHFVMVVVNGQRSTLKQGTKIPVAVGTSDLKSGGGTAFQYLDVGVNLDATLTDYAGGGQLKSKVEVSSAAPEGATIAGVTEPIIRQSVIDGVYPLTTGKPAIIGSIDAVGTGHRLDVAVEMDQLP